MSETEQKPETVTESTASETAASDDVAMGSQDLQALQTKLAEAEAKAAEHWDQLLRTRAEMENIRRRGQRELENAHKYALEKFAQELIPVKDSLEMGLAAAQADTAHVEQLREGTALTLKMFNSVMDKFDIKEIHPLDEPFNPEHHQAMSMLEAPDKAPNTVINVMQKGYLLNERLIRPAMVVVSKAPAESK